MALYRSGYFLNRAMVTLHVFGGVSAFTENIAFYDILRDYNIFWCSRGITTTENLNLCLHSSYDDWLVNNLLTLWPELADRHKAVCDISCKQNQHNMSDDLRHVLCLIIKICAYKTSNKCMVGV